MTANADNRIQRVLMTADCIGGVWHYSLELARALAPYGVHVTLAVMGGPMDDSKRTAAARLLNVSLDEGDWKLEWMQDPWKDVAEAGTWLLELEEECQPDIVHLGGYAHAALPFQAPVLVVGHSCVASWFEAVRGESPPPEFDRYMEEVRNGLASADAVTAPTQTMLDALRKHYGGFSASAPIPNGVRAKCFPPTFKERFVMTAGRLWDEAKNTATLDAVAGELPAPVYMAGDAQHPSGGRAEFRGMRPLGRLDAGELADWLGRACIFALPARYEPFGLTPVQAALAGCALVLGDIDSLREVWGENADFVHPDDPAALRRRLEELLADEELRLQRAEAARQRALAYTVEAMAAKYMRRYRYMLGELSPAFSTTKETAT